MYYKIENKDCKVYKELRAMREKELSIEEENKKAIAEKIPYTYESFYGRSGQQKASRVSSYEGFCFKEPDKIDKQVWKPSKVDSTIFVPNRRTKAGREIIMFLRALKKGSYTNVLEILGLSYLGAFIFPYVEIAEDILILYIDDSQEPKDENVIEITKKEFDSIIDFANGNKQKGDYK